jgi:hypothetical protein
MVEFRDCLVLLRRLEALFSLRIACVLTFVLTDNDKLVLFHCMFELVEMLQTILFG